MKTRFIIFRHGQTDWNIEHRPMGKRDIPLNDAGKEQVEKLALRFATEQINVFYSSPLKRAKETADIIAGKHGKQAIIMKDLIEMNLGKLEGKTKKARIAMFPEFDPANDVQRTKMGMETFSDWIPKLEKQMVPGLLKVHAGQTIALSTHDQKMRAILIALGMPEEVKGEILKNSAVSIIEIDNGKVDIICHNDTSHLE
ncbi:histidine phosphatase family protein [Patescibacteria group bacterium]|nr:histidine phosphatase family protein [Patescibacteria group bacterium]